MLILFTLFSLDVFRDDKGMWEIIGELVLHNIPTFAMIVILVIAWRCERCGGILLMLSVIGSTAFLIFGSGRFMWCALIMIGIPFLIGALFVVNYYFLGNGQWAMGNGQKEKE